MARTKYQGPVYGPYFTFHLIAKTAVIAGQTLQRVDQIPMLDSFRVCQASLDARGTTAVVTATLTNNTNSLHSGTVVSSGTPKTVAMTDWVAGRRTILRGDSLELRITTDGGGTIDAGEVSAQVTGYFVDLPTRLARYADSGQSLRGGPVSGFYDCIEITNLQAVGGGQAEAAFGAVIMPYACKVMAISYGAVGLTETTGGIFARVRNATSTNFLHSLLDVDAFTTGTANADGRANITPATGLALVNRDVARGDVLELHLTTGASDAIPISGISARVWVWVKGQVANLDEEVLDHPSAVTGPALGGLVGLRFVNRRAAQAGNRSEDAVLLPCDLRYVAAAFHKMSANSTSRQISNSGAAVTGGFTTTAFALHNEGNTLPAPGSWTGGVPVVGIPPGEDSGARNWVAGDTIQFAEQIVGDAALNDSAHVLCVMRSHPTTEAND